MQKFRTALAIGFACALSLPLLADDGAAKAIEPKRGAKAGFFGAGTTDVESVVFAIDHSGSLIDTFDFLREEVKAHINRMDGGQKAAILFFSEKVDECYPKEPALTPMTPTARREVVQFVDNVRAAGKNDDLYDPFASAMEKALALQPKVVFFLTDGNFDPRIVDTIKKLNKDVKARIYTIGFVKISPEAETSLKTIAKDSGGDYKFVSAENLSEKK